ncbi:hypothetical protein AJ88_24095 [Mesorhizobium amorphae CCBAU 01583]|nr:hypothetical protein AJ88_24095 [Mesorhizobium amorphae CCBAU 01583]
METAARAALALDVDQLARKWPIQIVAGKVGVDDTAQLVQRIFRLRQLVELVMQRAGFRLGRTDERADARQDLNVVRVAANRLHARLDVSVKFLRIAECLMGCEDRLGIAACERPSLIQRSGLPPIVLPPRRLDFMRRLMYKEDRKPFRSGLLHIKCCYFSE